MRILLSISLALMVALSAKANEELSIAYPDWDNVLKQTVMETGLSDRKPAQKIKSQAGTRLSKVSRMPTRLEANRIFFHALTDENKAYVASIVSSLSKIPSEVPLDAFPANEQLAFWLNLHNSTAYSVIAANYPETNLKSLHAREWGKKRLSIDGRDLSLAEIEAYVVARWQDPRVLYGFFQGTIGGPNLRREAYTGDNVWGNLEDNAREFVNSLRGLQFKGNTALVSRFYKTHSGLFPNFEADLQAHMMQFTNVRLTSLMANVDHVKAKIEDWYVADLYNGHLGLTSSANTNPARFIMAMSGSKNANPMQVNAMIEKTKEGRYPKHVQQFLTELVERKRHLREAQVEIEDVSDDQETEN